MKLRYVFPFALFFVFSGALFGQDCLSKVKLKLNNISSGGVFKGQTVELKSTSGGKTYTAVSDENGEVEFQLPCDQRFDVSITNYAGKDQIKSPPYNNSTSTRNYSYEADMLEKRKAFAMNESERAVVDKAIVALPDTTFLRSSIMPQPRDMDNYAMLDITLIDLDKKFLVGEEITFSGQDRNKSFKTKTGANGHVRVYLPKGDTYMVNFHYHKNYRMEEVAYSKGTSTIRIEINYMGTKEYLRRKKEEEERMEREKQQAAIALASSRNEYTEDKVLEIVMDRNNWKNKLLISDVSSEMLPYALKLAKWYNEHRSGDTKTQFVLYNNYILKEGSDAGSALYMVSPNYDSLVEKIRFVHDGIGFEKAEHDLKELITNKGLTDGYEDVILFVDKDAGLRDYEHFKNLTAPVHIVLCVDDRRPNAQHLTVAWKTKGSVHSISGDYTDIGNLQEGDTFKMEGFEYKLMGGEFVSIR